MPADPVKNFAKVLAVGSYDASATTIQLASGELSKLPNPSTDGQFNLVWWNATDYTDPADDPYKEIVRVTAVNNVNNTITIIRGQENTIAQPHNIPNKVYKMMLALTQKTYEDLQKIDVYQGSTFIGYRNKLSFVSPLTAEDDAINQLIKISLTGKFGGDGSDGDLIISSGTTTIDLQNKKIFIKNYRNLKITGTASLNFINPHNEGTLIIFRVKNNCEITSTANPAIDLRLLGGMNGLASSSPTGNGTSGTSSPFLNLPLYLSGGGGGIYNSNAGAGGDSKAGLNPNRTSTSASFNYLLPLAPGSGGGGGSGGNSSSGNAGRGGRGGGCLFLEVGDSLTFSSTINASGENGQNAVGHWGSGGGGGGGAVVIVYNNLIQNTGTINVSGGTGGIHGNISGTVGAVAAGGGGGASCINPGSNGLTNNIIGEPAGGGNGGEGLSMIIKNTYF